MNDIVIDYLLFLAILVMVIIANPCRKCEKEKVSGDVGVSVNCVFESEKGISDEN